MFSHVKERTQHLLRRPGHRPGDTPPHPPTSPASAASSASHGAISPLLPRALRALDALDGRGAPDAGAPSETALLPYRRDDFRANGPDLPTSALALREHILRLGAAGKGIWLGPAMAAYRQCGRSERADLLLTMAWHGLEPDEAEAAGLRFPARRMAEALVALALRDRHGWVRHLTQQCLQRRHLLHRSRGNRCLDQALEAGDAVACRVLVQAGFTRAEQPWDRYFEAARSGDTAVLQAAVAAGVRFDARHQRVAAVAARHGHLPFVQLLHRHGMPVQCPGKTHRILLQAVLAGHTEVVAYLLEQGARVRPQDSDARGHTVMAIALAQGRNRGDCEMATLLKRYGCPLRPTELQSYVWLTSGFAPGAAAEPTLR